MVKNKIFGFKLTLLPVVVQETDLQQRVHDVGHHVLEVHAIEECLEGFQRRYPGVWQALAVSYQVEQ